MTKLKLHVPHVAGLYGASIVTKYYTASVFRGTLEAAHSWRVRQAQRPDVLHTAIRHSPERVDIYDQEGGKPESISKKELHALDKVDATIPDTGIKLPKLVSVALTTSNRRLLHDYCFYQNIRKNVLKNMDDDELESMMLVSEHPGNPSFREIYCSLEKTKTINDFLDVKLAMKGKPDQNSVAFRTAFASSVDHCIDLAGNIITGSSAMLGLPFDDLGWAGEMLARAMSLSSERRSKHSLSLIDAVGDNFKWPKENSEFDAMVLISSPVHLERFKKALVNWKTFIE